MSTTAELIASELRRRIPDVGQKKLHKLLYYAQGAHLATFGEPLFTEPMSAYDHGPIVGQLWWAENNQRERGELVAEPLGEAELNTVGYVVSRYGRLTGADLERLTHSEDPWIEADAERIRKGDKRATISVESMMRYFMRETVVEDEAEGDPDGVESMVSGAQARLAAPASIDSVDGLLARMR